MSLETRRTFLGSIGACLAIAGTGQAEAAAMDECEFYAAQLAQSMARRFGGEFRAEVNAEYGAVYIFRISA